MNLKLIIKKNITLSRCPNCNDVATLRRSRSRSFFERIMKKLKFKYYSCQKCGWRGSRFAFKLAKNYKVLIIFYIILSFVTAVLVQKLLTSYFE
jgi:predicted RNA-binding Zn-ribbon protein involved in translation (DUF1610 family)